MKTISAILLLVGLQNAFANTVSLECAPFEVLSQSDESIRIELKRADVIPGPLKGLELISEVSPIAPYWREINGHSVFIVKATKIENKVYGVKLKLHSYLTVPLKLKSDTAYTVCTQ